MRRVSMGCSIEAVVIPWDSRRLLDFLPDILRGSDVLTPLTERTAILVFDELLVVIQNEALALLVVAVAATLARVVELVLRLVSDDGFDHRDGCRVERAVSTANLADHLLHLGNRPDEHVLLLK